MRQQFFEIIEVDLCEENGEHPTFETGKTTVTLHFKQMVTSGIVVTLPGNSSNSEFPNNKTSSHKIRLPYPLELNGNWKEGSSSITLPDTYPEMSILKEHEHV